MSDAFEAAWSVLKADPDMGIREMANYSPTYPSNVRNPSMSTMNPIIARLIRERNEQRAADRGSILHDFMRQRPDRVDRLDYTSYSSEEKRPHSEFGRNSRQSMPGPSYSDKISQSRDAHEAAGVVPGDRFSGDYVVKPEGIRGGRRFKGTFADKLDFPYGGRSGPYPVNVEPRSPMARMYELAPALRSLPENLQPDWMSEFRGD